jgi:hypothetical protein
MTGGREGFEKTRSLPILSFCLGIDLEVVSQESPC